jgi:hypothetical protein
MNYCTGALDHLDAVKNNIKRDLNKYDKLDSCVSELETVTGCQKEPSGSVKRDY